MVSFIILLSMLVCVSSTSDEKVLVLYIQGFPNWFLKNFRGEENILIGFEEMMREGVIAEYVIPEFPTLTPPNMFSVLTGEHPETHGISSEFMYDPQAHKYFKGFRGENDWDISWWNKSSPIYVTAAEQGKKVSLYWWPGCNIPYTSNPNITCKPYLPSDPEPILSNIPNILQEMSEGVDLTMIYYKAVDEHAKIHGPYSASTKTQVAHISNILFQIQGAISAFEMEDQLNLVVVSDRGISDVQLHNLYFIDDFVDVSMLKRIVNDGATMHLYPKTGHANHVHTALSKLPHSNIYWMDTLPDRWHLSKAPFLPPLTLVADPGYAIYCRICKSVVSSHLMQQQSQQMSSSLSSPPHFDKGISGYDNSALDMRAIFMARGPSKGSFK